MTEPGTDSTEQVSPARLGIAMLLISFATVLFTLSVWKLLSFFIMPSLFFDLLFVGFPVGAFLGVKFFRVSLRSFLGTLWILQGAMLLSVAACLVCKQVDYLRAHLFEVNLVKLMGQMGTFTVLFIPFFCAYGLSEYVGYQLGTLRLGGRMRFVYAVYLFGAAFAYLVLQPALRSIGITGVIGASVLLVAAASLLLSVRGLERGILGAEIVLLASTLALWPRIGALESQFLSLYKGHGTHSTHAYVEDAGYKPRFQRWGKYGLTEVLFSPEENQFTGFYNDLMQWEFTKGTGFSERKIGAVPINFAPRDGKIAIIGSGGGRQVQWARQPQFSFKEILALELEPAVFEAVRGDLKAEFGWVYEAPNVRPICAEARGYMEASTESFDLIFMPSVGGYPQMMLEPGNMIRTVDAYRTLRNRLTDRGVLAIWYPFGLDTQEILTKQYVRTLGEQGLQMKTRAYRDDDELLILAAKNPSTPLPSLDEIDAFLTAPKDPSGLPPLESSMTGTRTLFVPNEATFKPITDDQPYLAGNVRNIFSLKQLNELFGVVAGLLALTGAIVFFGLKKSGDPRIPGRSYAQVAGVSFLVGLNFILLEHYVVLSVFKKMYVFQDSLALGAVSFLIVSGCGSVFITQRSRAPIQVAALACLGTVVFLEKHLPVAALLACLLPVAFATGSFFPAIFELACRNPLAVFAMDAVGAAVGSALAFFIPIAFGLSVFFPIAALVFAATSFLSSRFCGYNLQNLVTPAPRPQVFSS